MAINLEQKAGESTERYYRRLAKAADQRLVRLEALAHEENYRNVKEWSYKRAMNDIKKWSGEGATRFNTKLPGQLRAGEPLTYSDKVQIQSKIRDIKTFLEAPTSTKKGITETYKKRADTLNQRYGTSFNWEHLGNFFESKTWEKIDSTYGSKTKMKSIGTIRSLDLDALEKKVDASKGEDGEKEKEESQAERAIRLIEEANKYNVKISDDRQVDATIKGWIKAEGVDFEDFFK